MGAFNNIFKNESFTIVLRNSPCSPSLTIKKLELPPIPLSIFHLPPQFQPFQFLEGLKSDEIDSSVDTSQFPSILQTILGGVAMVADQFPFIKDWVVKFEPTQDATMRGSSWSITICFCSSKRNAL